MCRASPWQPGCGFLGRAVLWARRVASCGPASPSARGKCSEVVFSNPIEFFSFAFLGLFWISIFLETAPAHSLDFEQEG